MPDKLTFVQVAELILRRMGKRMKVEEIVDEGLRQGLLVTKSIDKAATMRYSLDKIYRSATTEDSNLVKIGPNLWTLKELMGTSSEKKRSERFIVGGIYNRKQIATSYGTHDANIRSGVFRPKNSTEILLFVTENKEKSQVPYRDKLSGEVLEWDGQEKGRTDYLVKEHQKLGLKLLVFYRKSKRSLPNYAFEYIGSATCLRSEGSTPTHFWLRLDSLQNSLEDESTERSYKEGTRKVVTCSEYERNPMARSDAIRIRGLTCEACGFNFEEFYGARGKGYAEVHHKVPLSETRSERRTDPVSDLTILCSNCHRMIHRIRNDTILPEDLRSMIQSSFRDGYSFAR